MSYLGSDFSNIDKQPRRRSVNVSESTVLFDEHQNPMTPLRRTMSGSSIEMLLTKDTETEADPFIEPRNAPAQEIDFDLFNTLLLELPATQRYVHFKGILSHYFTILAETKTNASEDRYIITIYNQLRHSNDQSKLEKVIDLFLKEPANDAMKLSNFLHFKEYKSHQRLFKLWLIKRRKFAELNKSQQVWEMYQRKKFWGKWAFKYGVYTEDFEDNAEIFQKVKSQMKFFDIWLTNLEERDSFREVADLQVQRRFFLSWKKKLVPLDVDPNEVYETSLIRKMFQCWKLNTKLQCSDLKTKTALHIWKKSFSNTKSMMDDALELEMVFHGGFFFSKWRKKYETVAEHESNLEEMSSLFQKHRTLLVWSEQLKFKQIENTVLDQRDHFLKQFVMNQFKQRFINDQKASSFNQGLDFKTAKRILRNWRHKLASREHERVIKWRAFDLWRKRHQLLEREAEHDMLKLQKSWEKWSVVLVKRQNSLELAAAAFDSYSRVIYFKNWRAAVSNIRALEKTADIHLARKVLKKWKEKKSLNDQMERDASNFRTTESTSLTTKRFYEHWVKKYDAIKEATLMQKLADPTMDNNLKLTVLQLWSNKIRDLVDLEQHFKQNQLVQLHARPLIGIWFSKLQMYQGMSEQAEEMNRLNLLSTGFTKLQISHYRTQELEQRLIEHLEDVELKTILKHLNAWSLQLMKVRRDKEVINRFQARWNRAHLRAILLLWQGKAMDAQVKRFSPMVDEYESVGGDEQEDTAGLRPLPRVSPLKQEDIGDDVDDDSPTKMKSLRNVSPFLGLQTPQKAVLDPYSIPALTMTRGSIPGSERIKRKRMEALKTRYSQAKFAIPSPLKDQRTPASGRIPSSGSSKKLDFGDLNIFRKT